MGTIQPILQESVLACIIWAILGHQMLSMYRSKASVKTASCKSFGLLAESLSLDLS